MKAEEAGVDEKSPSVTSLVEHTLYRQKSRSFVGSEKGQDDVHKDSVQVKHPAVHNLLLVLKKMSKEGPKKKHCFYVRKIWYYYLSNIRQ